MKPHFLIVLTDPKDLIARIQPCLSELKEQIQPDVQIYCVATIDKAEILKTAGYRFIAYRRFRWYNLSLLYQFATLQPQAVTVLFDNTPFHPQLYRALRVWKYLLPPMNLSLKPRGERVQPIERSRWQVLDRISNKQSFTINGIFFASCVVFVTAIALTGGLPALLSLTALFIALELSLRSWLPTRKDRKVRELPKEAISARHKRPKNIKVFDIEFGYRNRSHQSAIGTFLSDQDYDQKHREYQITTDGEGDRITSPPKCPQVNYGSDILLTGCSWTYGTGISDQDTFAWAIQQSIPEYQIKNLGVEGYSPYQSLLQLEERFDRCYQREQPTAVVYCHIATHLMRNLGEFFQLPYTMRPTCEAMTDEKSEIRLKRTPLQRPHHLLGSKTLRTVDELEYLWNFLRSNPTASRKMDAMKGVLHALRALCKDREVPLLIAILTHWSPIIPFLLEEKFSFCISSIDHRECREDGSYPWRLVPFDGHPNEKAHRHYGDMIAQAIDDLIAGSIVSPTPEVISKDWKIQKNIELSDTLYPIW